MTARNLSSPLHHDLKLRRSVLHETDIAGAVVLWLQDGGWTVYQEVSTGYAEPIADIVAVKDDIAWIIETKTSMSLQLLDQAYRWAMDDYWCNRVSIAIPELSNRTRCFRPRASERFLRDHGIGLITVEARSKSIRDENSRWHTTEVLTVGEKVLPKDRVCLNGQHIKGHLVEAQQTWAAAGNNSGKRWTPFQQTCENLRAYVSVNPGALLKDCIRGIQTHYASPEGAVQTLRKLIDSGVIKGLELRVENRQTHIYPSPQPVSNTQGELDNV